MITDQECFNIAEFLTHNKDYLKQNLTLSYHKAKNMDRPTACSYIEDHIKYQLAEHTKYTPTDIEHAFCDERVRIVVDKLFLKDFYYEH